MSLERTCAPTLPKVVCFSFSLTLLLTIRLRQHTDSRVAASDSALASSIAPAATAIPHGHSALLVRDPNPVAAELRRSRTSTGNYVLLHMRVVLFGVGCPARVSACGRDSTQSNLLLPSWAAAAPQRVITY